MAAPTDAFQIITDAEIAAGQPITTGWANKVQESLNNVYSQLVGEPLASPPYTPAQAHDHDGVNSKLQVSPAIYGSGADGALSVPSGTTTLLSNRTYSFTSISVAAGAILRFDNGFCKVGCTGDADIFGTLEVYHQGTGGVGAVPGPGGAGLPGAFSVFGLSGGGAGGTNGLPVTDTSGGGGGAGVWGNGGASSAEGTSAPAAGGVSQFTVDTLNAVTVSAAEMYLMQYIYTLWRAAGGGGGTGAGGDTPRNGGYAGGNGIIAIKGDLDGNSTGVVKVDGGGGQAGTGGDESGGGGGGAGGLWGIVGGVVDNISWTANGGAGATGNPGNAGGGGGGGGGISKLMSGGAQTGVTVAANGGAGGGGGTAGGAGSATAIASTEPERFWY